jgi:lipopolysaccharide transport system permease protein
MMQKSINQVMIDTSPSLTIDAGYGQRQYWKDLWHYRELIYFLALRDISVRYKQTFLGIAWAVMRPLLTMMVFTLVFGKLAGLPSGSTPYPLLVFVAMLPWQLFAGVLVDSGNSIVNNGSLISKIYFPRLIIPLSAVIVSLVDFAISAVILAALMAWHGMDVTWRMFALPFFIAIALITSIGAGLWVAALNVRYRDFRFIVAFSVQLGLYISPVGFTSAIVPNEWRLLYALNPLVGVIDGFRWALLENNAPLYWPGLLLSACVAIVLLVSAIIHFRKAEKSFADNI